MTEAVPLLRLENVAKRYGAIEALRGVTFDLRGGEVVALLGDNGAGKSTLVKIISGGQEATAGRILFEGRERASPTPTEAKAAGIETVYQDLSLCTNVDVVANFFMGRELTRKVFGIPVLREREMYDETAERARRRRHAASRRSGSTSSISPAASARRSSSTASSIGAASWCSSTSRSPRSASSRRGAGWT